MNKKERRCLSDFTGKNIFPVKSEKPKNGCGLIVHEKPKNGCGLIVHEKPKNGCGLIVHEKPKNGCGLIVHEKPKNGCGLIVHEKQEAEVGKTIKGLIKLARQFVTLIAKSYIYTGVLLLMLEKGWWILDKEVKYNFTREEFFAMFFTITVLSAAIKVSHYIYSLINHPVEVKVVNIQNTSMKAKKVEIKDTGDREKSDEVKSV